MRLVERGLRRPRAVASGDDGFSLIEAIVALSIVVVVLISAAPLFFKTLASTAGLGQRQDAVTIANARIEYLRSLTPSSLVTNRASADVVALNAAPGLVNLSGDVIPSGSSDALKDYDPNATSSTNAVVPLTQTQTVKNVVYTTRTFINVCYLTSSGVCSASSSTGPPQYRIDVDVSWPRRSGVNCAGVLPGMCEYVVTTIRNPSSDPVFSSAAAPTVTTMTSTPTQVTAANVTVHRGQKVALTLTGTGFAYSTTLMAQDPTDTVTYNQPTTSTTLTGTFMSSTTATLGGHVLNIVNSDGTSTTTYLNVTASAPTITKVATTPATSPLTVALPPNGQNGTYTFTLTGTDLYATPTVQPTISFSGTRSAGSAAVTYAATNVAVASPTSLTFQFTYAGSTASYSDTGTITLTNPDGQPTTFPFAVTV